MSRYNTHGLLKCKPMKEPEPKKKFARLVEIVILAGVALVIFLDFQTDGPMVILLYGLLFVAGAVYLAWLVTKHRSDE